MSSLYQTLYWLNLATVLCLGFFVFYKDVKSKINILFLFFSLSLFGWLITLYFYYNPLYTQQLLSVGRLNFIFVELATYFLLLFVYHFPVKIVEWPSAIKSIAVFETLILILLTAFSPLVAKDELVLSDGGRKTVFGGLYVFFVVHFFLYTLASIIVLLLKLKSLKGILRVQLMYFTTGLTITIFVGSLTNIIMPYYLNNFGAQNVGSLATFFIVFFTSYAIVKHHLLNVKVIAAEMLTLALIVISLIDVLQVKNGDELIFRGIIFVFLSIFGYYLILSVLNEIRQKDIQKELNSKLSQANDQLKELLQMKSEFLDIASHQLRTPLSAMIGLLSMQYDGDFEGMSKEEQREQQKNMLTAAERLRGIVHDLMDAMEVEGGIKLKLRETDMSALVQEAVNTLKPNYDSKKLYLNFDKTVNALPEVMADPTMLTQVFMNLVDDACQYTEQGGASVRVFPKNNELVFEIKDTGIGVTEQEKKKMFGKFERGKRAMLIHPDGSGLGLFIVKKIVDAHNGRIEMDSEGENTGTTFRVFLPCVQKMIAGDSLKLTANIV